MLADLTLLLHEMSDALRGRALATRAQPAPAARPFASASAAIIVTGVASPQKARFIDALRCQFGGIAVVVRSDAAWPTPPDIVLRVHAETDLEAMIEGQSDDRAAARAADLVIPVDWEPLARSLTRIAEALVARGVDAAQLGV
jgi:hypothetical protein